jgi:formylglycine-generating enzyme required for sulfatase activity/serine/threonine protein kinase
MLCCLNPECDRPLNPETNPCCHNCGTPLISLLRNRYQVLRPLGRGGFGKTYLAKDTDKLNETCVVKQLALQAQGTWARRKAVQLFEQEAKQLQRLGEHPQIPALLAYFQEGQYLYLVQQFVTGQNLFRELQQQGQFREAQIRSLLLDLLPVLQYIHERGVIHRDLKLENLMRCGDGSRLILIDFGVAKVLNPSGDVYTGTTLGSKGYAPLEQLLEGKVTPASDLFSLGICCFHLLSQIHPFELWVKQGYSWLSNWPTYISNPLSSDLVAVLNQLLQCDLKQRYQSAAAVLADLQPVAAAVPVLAVPPPPLALPLVATQPPFSEQLTPRLTLPQRQTRRRFLTFAACAGVGLAGTLSWGAGKRLIGSPPSSSETLAIARRPRMENFVFATVRVNRQGQVTERLQRQAQSFQEDLGNGVILEMVWIPGGTFFMGTTPAEIGRDRHEGPQHTVTLAGFYLGKFTVTQTQFQAVANWTKVQRDLNPDPSRFKGDDRPVEEVGWADAVEFCERLSQKTGHHYRLPSEAEWEYACRAGTTTPFAVGETITTDLANYNGNDTYGNGPSGQYRQETIAVGQFPPNPFGLHDMHGNVWEWCADPWHDSYVGAPSDGRIWEQGGDSNSRILRGGSWGFGPQRCRSASRGRHTPEVRNSHFGFRVSASWM